MKCYIKVVCERRYFPGFKEFAIFLVSMNKERTYFPLSSRAVRRFYCYLLPYIKKISEESIFQL